MAYERLKLEDGEVLTAEHIAHMEDGIENAAVKEETSFTEAECRAAFMKEMAVYSKRFGASNSVWGDPTGITNVSTAHDMCMILAHAAGYERLYDIWNTPSQLIRRIQKDGSVTETTVTSSVVASSASANLTDYYKVMGGKTGTLNAGPMCNLAVIVQGKSNPDDWYAVVVLNADTANGGGGDRFDATKAVMDYIEGDTSANPCAKYAYAVKLPHHSPRAFQYLGFDPAYNKSGSSACKPASTTKLLDAILILDYVSDLQEKITVTQGDYDALVAHGTGWFGNDIYVGETLTYLDLLYAMMLPSSNIATHIVCRGVGEKILKSRNL